MFNILKKYKLKITVIALVAIFLFIIIPSSNPLEGLETSQVTRKSLIKSISESGIIETENEAKLSFDSSGIVKKILKQEGDTVKKGETIMYVDQTQAQASSMQTEAQIKIAEAQLAELINGITTQEEEIAKNNLEIIKENLIQANQSYELVKSEQSIKVENTKKNLYSSNLQAYLENSFSGEAYASPEITGVLNNTVDGSYFIEVYPSNSISGYSIKYSGLENGTAEVSATRPIPLGSGGLYLQFSSNSISSNLKYEIPVPNTKNINYLSLLQSYETALKNQEIALNNAEQSIKNAEINLALAQNEYLNKISPARAEKIKTQEAQLMQAKSQRLITQSQYNQTVIQAPFDGVISNITIKEGERISAGQHALTVSNNDALIVTLNISETDIEELKEGNQATITFDAYKNFETQGEVVFISPTANIEESVTAFKVKVSINNQNNKLKAGVTANVEIKLVEKENVLSVPIRAVFIDANQKEKVKTITLGNQIEEKFVKTGIQTTDGEIEILSGLQEKEAVITFIDDKARKYLESKQ